MIDSVIQRTIRSTKSYLKTRIRGSRLLNAARILAIIELSHRLHQAYRYAYDEQAAEWLLPQNPTPEQRAATRAADLLRNNNCSNFISELISIAANVAGQPWAGLITPSFRPLLANANGDLEPSYQPDIALVAYGGALAQGRVTASGRSGRSGDVITYGTTTNYNTIAWNREFYSLGLDDQALMTLHESLHLIPNFSDFAIAGAAHIMATRDRNNCSAT